MEHDTKHELNEQVSANSLSEKPPTTTLHDKYNDDYDVEPIHAHSEDEEDSPIEEVRLVVPNTDDPTLPVYTFRMWFLSIIFCCALAFINQFFWFRQNAMVVTPLVIQLISFPLGKIMEKVIPKSRFFNPGPFNMKEHVLITVMANCSVNTAYAVDIITIQRLWYGQDIGWGGGLLLIWTTQLLGYGLAGLCRRFLVYPPSMVWPGNLANISLFRSFHIADKDWTGPTRMRWFLYCFCAMFVYYWLPGYFFQILTFFSWACWINTENRTLAQLTGGFNGLGMLAVTFDWSTIVSYLQSPLVVPWWAIGNVAVGFVIVAWIISPALYYSNVWDAQKFPIITQELFDKFGEPWNNSMVLTPERTLNETAYAEYGPLYMTSFFAFTYGIGFAGLTAVISHTILYHGKDIITQYKRSREEDMDIHGKLMRAYPEVPQWWYIATFIVAFGVSFAVIYCWPMQLPWWGIFLAAGLAAFFVLPIGIIQALTNQQPGLNVITELIIGFALPGNPIGNVTFKTYGYISMYQCLQFVNDLKLGHYTKIPPKAMYMVQTVGTIIAGIINLVTARWLMDTVPDICTDAGYPFTCPSARTFYSASIVWGVVSPRKMFGPGSVYNSMLWFFLIGFLLPVPFWLAHKKWPNVQWLKYVHIPVILNATGMMPPAVPLNFSAWCAAGFVFMWYLRRYKYQWWSKYNYITSAAFDSAVAIGAIVIFGVVTGSGYTPDWWGNGGQGVNGMFDNCPLALANASNDCALC
ncbi:OPT family small oligopeptide transporter [Lichtheimia ornata]|uniref:OPT family small oligopeptide transporter n=1 Tax=Lichtheimia ornata TaxID=688661 RepID=A0AAD7V939_9FUNG|nr:OPT family small oligopeptide transporter [Lichtheimia ornata]KAJ8661319.1 OPT family small oligopeptide transporter [Lichtheimia ornata]